MLSRRSLAKAYVQLMDEYSSEQLAAAMAPLIAENKLDVDLLAKDISAEILLKKKVLTGSLTMAHAPADGQITELMRGLGKAFEVRDMHLDITVDPEIVGGFVAETPAGMVDSSVITMLDKLEVA